MAVQHELIFQDYFHGYTAAAESEDGRVAGVPRCYAWGPSVWFSCSRGHWAAMQHAAPGQGNLMPALSSAS